MVSPTDVVSECGVPRLIGGGRPDNEWTVRFRASFWTFCQAEPGANRT
jgi:hypothetical protein